MSTVDRNRRRPDSRNLSLLRTGTAMIERAYVDVDGIHLDVRFCGDGPPVLLLHQSPVSARTVEPQMAAFAGRALCIAPDLPGLGRSDGLDHDPVTIGDMAACMLALLDRLGIGAAAVYGSHTGALVATEMALQAPDRIRGPIVDGYPIYTEEEAAQRLVSYFPHAEARWDGGHLLWLWWRYREQFVYWPWNTKHPATRAACAVPPPDFLQVGVGEIGLRLHDYHRAYAAAFAYPALGALRRLEGTAHLVVADSDSLSRKTGLLDFLPSVRLWPVGSEDEQRAAEVAALDLLLDGLPAGPGAAAIRAAASATRRIVRAGGCVLRSDASGTGDAPPLVVLPPLPAESLALAPMLRRLRRRRTVVAIDLLDLADGTDPGDDVAAALAAIVDGAALRDAARVDVLAVGHGALLLAPLAAALGGRCGRLQALDPPLAALLAPPPGEAPPADAPCPSGSHLVRLWDRARLHALAYPDWHPRAGAPRALPEDLDGLDRWVRAALPSLSRPGIARHLAAARARPESWRVGRPWSVHDRWGDVDLEAAVARLAALGEPVAGPHPVPPRPGDDDPLAAAARTATP